MTASGWCLLAALTLIIECPASIYGQDASAARLAKPPTAASQTYSHPAELLHVPPIPVGPQRYVPVHGTISSQIVPAAGIIFSGRVTSVSRVPNPIGIIAASTVITFQVDDAIRGASMGQPLTIREWAGLWDRGERYRVGESVFLFLYPPSRLGLTSPVAGASGRFAVDPQRRIVMNVQNSNIFVADPVIGGRTVVPYADFARAVQRSLLGK